MNFKNLIYFGDRVCPLFRGLIVYMCIHMHMHIKINSLYKGVDYFIRSVFGDIIFVSAINKFT